MPCRRSVRLTFDRRSVVARGGWLLRCVVMTVVIVMPLATILLMAWLATLRILALQWRAVGTTSTATAASTAPPPAASAFAGLSGLAWLMRLTVGAAFVGAGRALLRLGGVMIGRRPVRGVSAGIGRGLGRAMLHRRLRIRGHVARRR